MMGVHENGGGLPAPAEPHDLPSANIRRFVLALAKILVARALGDVEKGAQAG